MHFSTPLVLFAAIVTGMLHMVPVSAVPMQRGFAGLHDGSPHVGPVNGEYCALCQVPSTPSRPSILRSHSGGRNSAQLPHTHYAPPQGPVAYAHTNPAAHHNPFGPGSHYSQTPTYPHPPNSQGYTIPGPNPHVPPPAALQHGQGPHYSQPPTYPLPVNPQGIPIPAPYHVPPPAQYRQGSQSPQPPAFNPYHVPPPAVPQYGQGSHSSQPYPYIPNPNHYVPPPAVPQYGQGSHSSQPYPYIPNPNHYVQQPPQYRQGSRSPHDPPVNSQRSRPGTPYPRTGSTSPYRPDTQGQSSSFPNSYNVPPWAYGTRQR
ncbi:hypothetical protein BC835DRAFT_488481 [Cytidiella melzeri]|nr:hypothetical protein BC835DRAFT_488481 [Cytidiella melzeri]